MIRHPCVMLTLSFVFATPHEGLSGDPADVPKRSPSGQTLLVPKDLQTLGEVYYVIGGAGTQFTLETDAPLLRLVATCNRVAGYFVTPFELENGRTPLFGGALRIPVASLNTGYERFDAGLHGSDGLNLADHPEILISFVSAGTAESVVKENNREQCQFNLVGEITIRNKTIRFESPARMTLLPFTRATEQFSPSDLLMVRTKLSISLAEVGGTMGTTLGPGFAGKSAELELYLMCTTVAPERSFDPRIREDLYAKQLMFMTKLRDFNDPVNAYVYGCAFMKEIWDDSRMLNDLALAVLTDEYVRRRDLFFVEEAAQQANKLTEYKDPVQLNTLALLCYERGDLDCVVKWSRKAVDNLAGQPFFVGPPIRAALEEYEAQAQMRPETKEVPGKE